MLRRFVLRRLAKEEKKLGVSLDYLQHMAGHSLSAFFKFIKIMPISTHRKALPVDAYHVARIVSTRNEDCGPCVQIQIAFAKQDGVNGDIIRATLDGRVEDLGEELADVYHFTQSVVNHSGDDGQWRDALRDRYGEQALVELALVIAAARVFPTAKRVLGYASSCSTMQWSV